MSVFQNIELVWGENTYVIPHDRVMAAIAVIEQHMTLSELFYYKKRSNVPVSKLISAYADVLRFAGAKVSPEEVYSHLFGENADVELMHRALNGILTICIPPDAIRQAEQKTEEQMSAETEGIISGN